MFIFMSMGVGGCSGDDSKWPSPPIKVDLTPYDKNPYRQGVEFSADSKLVCVGWCVSGASAQGPPLHVIFDANGKQVEGLCDAAGKFTVEGAKAFPRMVASPIMYLEPMKACSPFSRWLKDAGGWGFNHDFSLGLRLVNPRSSFDGRKLTLPVDDLAVWTAELWQLAPVEKLQWSVDLPPEIGQLELVEFFVRDGKPLILIGFGGKYVYILSQADSRLIETIDHQGRVEPVPQNMPRSWKPRSDPPALGSSRHEIAFSPSRKLLAFGQVAGKDVSVISIEKPPHIVFSDDTLADLPSPSGGIWSVDRVEFVAGGNFLIVGAHFGGRGTSRSYTPTVILDTHTWKRVWWENSNIISEVTLSPDGKQLAFVHATRWSKTLEFGPFIGKRGE